MNSIEIFRDFSFIQECFKRFMKNPKKMLCCERDTCDCFCCDEYFSKLFLVIFVKVF